MVNGLHLYSAFIQSALQFMPLIHPFAHTFTHQRRLAAMQGTNQLVRSNWGLGVLLRDTSTRPGWDRTSNPPIARRQVLPPEPYRPLSEAVGSCRKLSEAARKAHREGLIFLWLHTGIQEIGRRYMRWAECSQRCCTRRYAT